MKKYVAIITVLFLFNLSCTKEPTDLCQNLQEGIITDDKEKVSRSINKMILLMNIQLHTNDNLIKLTQRISSFCNVFAEVMCFQCIKTIPPQSEIRITVNTGNNAISKVIDITSDNNNRMVFVNMHN